MLLRAIPSLKILSLIWTFTADVEIVFENLEKSPSRRLQFNEEAVNATAPVLFVNSTNSNSTGGNSTLFNSSLAESSNSSMGTTGSIIDTQENASSPVPTEFRVTGRW